LLEFLTYNIYFKWIMVMRVGSKMISLIMLLFHYKSKYNYHKIY